MKSNDQTGRHRWERHSWMGRGLRWPACDDRDEIQVWPEWWSFEWERFEGSWVLEECHEDMSDQAAAVALTRMLAIRVAADAVRRDIRGEDLGEDIAAIAACLAELPLPAAARNTARRLLTALVPFDPETIALELLAMAWQACADGLDFSARSLAELAYDASASQGCHDAAQGAALALGRLASLQECPRLARRWRGIAYLHGKRTRQRTA